MVLQSSSEHEGDENKLVINMNGMNCFGIRRFKTKKKLLHLVQIQLLNNLPTEHLLPMTKIVVTSGGLSINCSHNVVKAIYWLTVLFSNSLTEA